MNTNAFGFTGRLWYLFLVIKFRSCVKTVCPRRLPLVPRLDSLGGKKWTLRWVDVPRPVAENCFTPFENMPIHSRVRSVRNDREGADSSQRLKPGLEKAQVLGLVHHF